MKSISQGNSAYAGGTPSQGSSSMYVYQGRIALSRGHSISVIDVIS